MEGRTHPTGGSSTQRTAEGQPATGDTSTPAQAAWRSYPHPGVVTHTAAGMKTRPQGRGRTTGTTPGQVNLTTSGGRTKGATQGQVNLTTSGGRPPLPQTPSAQQHHTADRRAVHTCPRQVIEGRGSNQALGQRTPTGLGIRIQNHTPHFSLFFPG